MLQEIFTAFAVVFLLWVVLEEGMGDTKSGKSSDSDGSLSGFILLPFLLLLGFAAFLWSVAQYLLKMLAAVLPEIVEWLLNMFRACGAALKKLFSTLRAVSKDLLKRDGVLSLVLRDISVAVMRMLRAVGKGIDAFLRGLVDVLQSFPALFRGFPRFLGRVATAFRALCLALWHALIAAAAACWRLLRFIGHVLALVVTTGVLFAFLQLRDEREERARRLAAMHRRSRNTQRAARKGAWAELCDSSWAMVCLFLPFLKSADDDGESHRVLHDLQHIGWSTREKMSRV